MPGRPAAKHGAKVQYMIAYMHDFVKQFLLFYLFCLISILFFGCFVALYNYEQIVNEILSDLNVACCFVPAL